MNLGKKKPDKKHFLAGIIGVYVIVILVVAICYILKRITLVECGITYAILFVAFLPLFKAQK